MLGRPSWCPAGGGGFSFSIPDGWSREADGDLLTAVGPGEEVVVLFFSPSQSTAEAFLDAIVGELDSFIEDAQITQDIAQEPVNGLTHVYLEGIGVAEGEPIDWDLTLVVGGRVSLVVVALGDLGGGAAVPDSIYSSIVP